MAQTNLNIRMDERLKRDFDELCDNIGMSMSTAICIFAKKAVSEQCIPFELSANAPLRDIPETAEEQTVSAGNGSGP